MTSSPTAYQKSTVMLTRCYVNVMLKFMYLQLFLWSRTIMMPLNSFSSIPKHQSINPVYLRIGVLYILYITYIALTQDL